MKIPSLARARVLFGGCTNDEVTLPSDESQVIECFAKHSRSAAEGSNRLIGVTGVDVSSFAYNGLDDRFQQIVNGTITTDTVPDIHYSRFHVNIIGDIDTKFTRTQSCIQQSQHNGLITIGTRIHLFGA